MDRTVDSLLQQLNKELKENVEFYKSLEKAYYDLLSADLKMQASNCKVLLQHTCNKIINIRTTIRTIEERVL